MYNDRNRKRLNMALIGIYAACLFASATAFGQHKMTKAVKDSIAGRIKLMMEADQQYRWMLMYGETNQQKLAELRALDGPAAMQRIKDVQAGKVGIAAAQKDSLWALQNAIDSANFEEIKGIINKYGYPYKFIADELVSTIIMHSSPRITDDFFKLLHKAAADGKMPGKEYALIYDRTMLERKQPELYYVIEHYDAKTRTAAPHKPIDEQATNRARAEIGLGKW